ncbi:MAG: glucose 1-dehydrogenase [Thermoplasmata archaeon]|nr:glucose 1-dehydrogenase [Thermoplasmata archaeon]
MRALLVTPPKAGVRLGETAEPAPGRDEVKVRVTECGLCGTDRDIVAGKYGTPPEGRTDLVLGHENLGKVIEVGAEARGFHVGDDVVATVRRGCGVCRFCRTQRSDFCETGFFTERGIKGRDGYLSEYYVERPEYLVRVPRPHRLSAVLLEPLSVVEKAVTQGTRVLDRMEIAPGKAPNRPRKALVAGTGAIGMLAALVLASEEFEVTAVDRHGDKTPAATRLSTIGAHHFNVSAGLSVLGEQRFDLVFDATGSAVLDFDLTSRLGTNGVLVVTGIPYGGGPMLSVPGGEILRRLVLQNQAIVGSVNANRRYFEAGLRHLTDFRRRWGTVAEQLISHRRPWTDYGSVLLGARPEGIKTVLTIGN